MTSVVPRTKASDGVGFRPSTAPTATRRPSGAYTRRASLSTITVPSPPSARTPASARPSISAHIGPLPPACTLACLRANVYAIPGIPWRHVHLRPRPRPRLPPANAPLTLDAVDPDVIDPLGGSRIALRGDGLTDADAVEVGGVAVAFAVLPDGALSVDTPALTGATAEVVVRRGEQVARALLTVWSPAELPGARVFDAAAGVRVDAPVTAYEWQRLTAEIAPDWRVRDGNTTTWFQGRFWMVAGWNGLQAPDGFSTIPEGSYPPENTTGEVWSSPDGVAWTLELPHGHTQFERRHVHNLRVWRDAMWMIGGDTHQGFYNHDVVRSADGVTWEEVLAPGEPPWEPRALQISGVFDGALWTGGGQSLLGPEEEYVHYNDLWRSDDGEHWTQIAADAPASETRWAGCGMTDGFVEFRGEMWLVGCARYQEVAGHALSNEVWSTPVLGYLITHEVAETVRRHPARYRALFTQSDRKEQITIRDDTLVPGKPSDWSRAIGLFEAELRARVPGGIMDALLPSY